MTSWQRCKTERAGDRPFVSVAWRAVAARQPSVIVAEVKPNDAQLFASGGGESLAGALDKGTVHGKHDVGHIRHGCQPLRGKVLGAGVAQQHRVVGFRQT